MTLKQFIAHCQEGKWNDNPELAEELYKFSKTIISNALGKIDSRTLTTEKFMAILVRDWIRQGCIDDDCLWLIKTGTNKDFTAKLRASYDEEYAEQMFDSAIWDN